MYNVVMTVIAGRVRGDREENSPFYFVNYFFFFHSKAIFLVASLKQKSKIQQSNP